MPEYLLDASAIYPLILRLGEEILDHASRFSILTLTPYEVGNALWREHRRGRVRELKWLAELFALILGELGKIDVQEHWRDVLKLAADENLTFYDASYLYVSRRLGLRLVTEDRDLVKYPEALRVKDLVKLLNAP